MLNWEKYNLWFLNHFLNQKLRSQVHTQTMCRFRLMCACYFKSVMRCKLFLNILINACMGGFREMVIQHQLCYYQHKSRTFELCKIRRKSNQAKTADPKKKVNFSEVHNNWREGPVSYTYFLQLPIVPGIWCH